jgi:pyridinium-3,5-biscarboxylic acid mononucleotide synthase
VREEHLLELLGALASGDASVEETLKRLRGLPFEEVWDWAVLDTHRGLRCGFAEVILAEGKRPEQCAELARRLKEQGDPFLITRADPERARAVRAAVPEAEWHEIARIVRWLPGGKPESIEGGERVAVVSAGTADQPVAEEAALTLETMGIAVERVYDVGIAGLHRLLARREVLQEAAVVIVAAGMEGALPSVVGGLISRPVIAVPTSVGYGVGAGGLAALAGMLTSCASGVTVVNIDNGFGAGYAAARILKSRAPAPAAAGGSAP